MNFNEEYKERLRYIDNVLKFYTPIEHSYQGKIFEAINYNLSAQGKRIRSMLMLEISRLFNGEDKNVEPFMAAIEMIHTYSLVHDDLPALDNDDYRRGRETTHIVFGEAMAILTGDALLNLAFETIVSAFTNTDYDVRIVKALQILSKKSGIYGMIGGQVADIEGTNSKEKLDFIYRLKTSALIEASMMIGAILAGASKEEILSIEQAARDIGFAFQIQDDILDVTSTIDVLGKPIGSDEKNKKVTYVTFLGLKESKQLVEEMSYRAIKTLKDISNTNEFLFEFISYLINRKK